MSVRENKMENCVDEYKTFIINALDKGLTDRDITHAKIILSKGKISMRCANNYLDGETKFIVENYVSNMW